MKSRHNGNAVMAQKTKSRQNKTMPKQIAQSDLDAIVRSVSRFPDAATVEEIHGALRKKYTRRTLQRRLALLVERGELQSEGRGRATRYRRPILVAGRTVAPFPKLEARGEIYIPVSPEGESIRRAIRKAIQERAPVGYNRAFLD